MGIESANPDDLSADEKRRFSRLSIDPKTVAFRRELDTNERKITVCQQGAIENGYTSESQFDITDATEFMAILALTTSLKVRSERAFFLFLRTGAETPPYSRPPPAPEYL